MKRRVLPNVIGAVALEAAIDALGDVGWDAIAGHDDRLARRMRAGLAAIAGIRVLGHDAGIETLPMAAFTVKGVPHALVAARLSGEYGIGFRHGCFCAPYLMRLLQLSADEIAVYRRAVHRGDRTTVPGAVRASAGLSTTLNDIDRLLAAVAEIASGRPAPVDYVQDTHTGDYWPAGDIPGWTASDRVVGASCARG